MLSNTIEIYTDGACSGNPGPGGYGIVMKYKTQRKEFSDGFSDNTDLARSLYVQRSFDNFDLLMDGLPIWAPLLYDDLIHAASMEGAES